MDYKNILAYQPIINSNVISIIEALQDNSLTKEQFHNHKAYAKKTKNLTRLLEYSIAFEIANLLEKDNG